MENDEKINVAGRYTSRRRKKEDSSAFTVGYSLHKISTYSFCNLHVTRIVNFIFTEESELFIVDRIGILNSQYILSRNKFKTLYIIGVELDSIKQAAHMNRPPMKLVMTGARSTEARSPGQFSQLHSLAIDG